MRYVLIALRVALAVVFLYAAYTKLRQPWLLFAMSIDAYQMLPEWAALDAGPDSAVDGIAARALSGDWVSVCATRPPAPASLLGCLSSP